MLALVALGLTLAVCGLYLLLSERFEPATLPRRQLDAWVALVTLGCLACITWEGFGARAMVAQQSGVDRQLAVAPATPVRRVRTPDLRTLGVPSEGRASPAVASEQAEELRLAVAPSAGEAESTGTGSFLAEMGTGAARHREITWPKPFQVETASPPTVGYAVERVTVLVPTATATPRLPATATPRPVEWPTATPRLAPTAVPWLPTLVLATAEPLPLATATPHCGDPERIALRIKSIVAAVERDGGLLTVRYVARVRNDGDFPATMADVMVTAVNRSGGSEQFGHDRLPDVTLMAGAVIDLEGALTLVKSPGPFGTTDLCVSFVGESCGRRAPYRVIRQCGRVSGL